MIEAFIFDMDGVIIDSEPMHFEVDIETLNNFGTPITQHDLEKYVGMTNPEMWEIIRREYRLSQTVTEIMDYQLSSKIRLIETMENEPIDGIRELITELRSRGIPLAVASSSPPKFIQAVLHKFNLTHMFDCVVSGEEVGKGKPAPDVFLEAARQLGVQPEHCLVLEDSKNGITAAKAAGMRCIGYLNPNSGNQDLSQADTIVASVRDIRLP